MVRKRSGARSAAADADTSAPPQGLDAIEAAGDVTTERDPALVRERLDTTPEAETVEGETDQAQPARRSRRGPGRPRGSRTRGGTKADAIERAAAAEAELARLQEAHGPDRESQLASLSAAIAGAVEMATEGYIRGKPEREGWRWNPDELKRWGDLWAEPLLPYMPALGTAAPFAIAIFGTGQLVMAKQRDARAVAARAKASPELTGGPDNAEAATAPS